MGLHCLWNADFTLLPLPLIADLKYGLLSAGAVLLVFSVIKKAIKQVLLVADGKTGSGGVIALVLWCAYFLPIGALAYRHFSVRR